MKLDIHAAVVMAVIVLLSGALIEHLERVSPHPQRAQGGLFPLTPPAGNSRVEDDLFCSGFDRDCLPGRAFWRTGLFSLLSSQPIGYANTDHYS